MTKASEKKQTADTYDSSATFFSDLFEKHGIDKHGIGLAFSKVGKENPKTVELGCGTGKDAEYITTFTNDYLGIDFSKELLKRAKNRLPYVHFKFADLETFEYPQNIDVVFAFACLLHTDKDTFSEILQNLCIKMNVGGVMLLSLAQGKYEKRIIHKKDVGTRTFYFYTPKAIENLLPEGLVVDYKKSRLVRGKRWFSLILKKSK